MRIEFLDGGVVVHEIDNDGIVDYRFSGRKLVAEDYFMLEPASVKLELVVDEWLLERWEDELVKVKDSMWLRYGVRVYDQNWIEGGEELVLTGLLAVSESSLKPVERQMEVVIYDHSALLSELEIGIRFYYPWAMYTGTDWTRFIINYQLPGEGENEPPEDDQGDDKPPWYPYFHTLETADRQLGSVLNALTQIWAECFAAHWELSFGHDYEAEGVEGTAVNNYIVDLGGESSFYRAMVQGLVQQAYDNFTAQTGLVNYQFWGNHGLIAGGQRMEIYSEYGILPSAAADAYLVIRAGWCGSGSSGAWNPVGWQGGEMIEANGPFAFREWWRVFSLKDGLCIQDSGQRFRTGSGLKLGNLVGSLSLNPAAQINLGEGSFWRCSSNDYYTVPEAYSEDVMGYFYTLSYYLYFTGVMQGPGGYIGNRIFRMKGRPGEPMREQYLEQSGRDWFKTMLFIGDLSCLADAGGVIRIVPRIPLADIELPLDWLTDIRQKLLVYQPWDKTKLQELINDRAEIDYLVQYYGGGRVLTHQLELEFAQGGFVSDPQLRQRFTLEGQICPSFAFSGPRQYMITSLEKTRERKLKIGAVRC